MQQPFENRKDAGMQLSTKLLAYADTPNLLVLGLPRGGVVVANEVASALNAELDIFVVRKLGTPSEPELAMGAIAQGGILLLNESVVNYFSISRETIEQVAQKELSEIERREVAYRNGRGKAKIEGRPVIVVDDGLATGATMKVAVRAIKRLRPSQLIVAVPVGAPSTCLELKSEINDAICFITPEPLMAVGAWYVDFEQTTDEEVKEILQEAADRYGQSHRLQA